MALLESGAFARLPVLAAALIGVGVLALAGCSDTTSPLPTPRPAEGALRRGDR
ncbi:MAG: hypothetical protein WDM84_02925 [Bauldia sp.]